ncbi:hypothetical protein CEXT_58661 [Caerostris extrusa]|uniref:Secreted protein n=1 Tax=Caerostris extrusa TaxID=172846 RepID=A0AAV4MGX8_CAEEX|nr:hypothetical protein CEXT_58661 [Caerostris extrusa]
MSESSATFRWVPFMFSCKKLIVLVAYLSTCPRTAGRVASATPEAVTSRLDFDISQSLEKICQGLGKLTSTCWSAEVFYFLLPPIGDRWRHPPSAT